MSTNDALAPVIAAYVHAVQTSTDGHWYVRSDAFWLSLRLERGTEQHVALAREAFRKHQIAISTSSGKLGSEAPDDLVHLTATANRSDQVVSISDLPDKLFGGDPAPVDPTTDPPIDDVTSSGPTLPATPTEFTTSGSVSRPHSIPSGHAAYESDAAVPCPSCGATLPPSASFCSGCGRPLTEVRNQLEQGPARTDDPLASLIERARLDGWAMPDDRTRQPGLPLTAMIVIGIVVLGIGARLGDALMPFLVVCGFILIGVSWWKPSLVAAVMDREKSRQVRGGATASSIQLVVAVASIAFIVLISVGSDMFGVSGGQGWNDVQEMTRPTTVVEPTRIHPTAPTATETMTTTNTPQPTVVPRGVFPTATSVATTP